LVIWGFANVIVFKDSVEVGCVLDLTVEDLAEVVGVHFGVGDADVLQPLHPAFMGNSVDGLAYLEDVLELIVESLLVLLVDYCVDLA